MRFIARTILAILVNGLGLWVAAQYIPGFQLTGTIRQILVIAAAFTILNLVLKPILKLILGPVIVLTLGIGLVLVNGILIYVLDAIFGNLMIETVPALLYATLLFSALNAIFHLAVRNK